MIETAEISVIREGEKVTVTGAGALDLTNAQRFREGIVTASLTADDVVADLRGAIFIDTAILEYLAKAAKAMLSRGKRLKVVVSEKSHPLRVLRTVGFGELMDIEVSSEE